MIVRRLSHDNPCRFTLHELPIVVVVRGDIEPLISAYFISLGWDGRRIINHNKKMGYFFVLTAFFTESKDNIKDLTYELLVSSSDRITFRRIRD